MFEIISKIEDYDKAFTIYISQKNIDEYKLKDDYIMLFKKWNDSKFIYSSIYYIYNDKTKLEYLTKLNINYNNIKKLKLKNKDDIIFNYEDKNNTINILNTFKNLEKLDISDNKISDINILEYLNFKELKELNLSYNEISDLRVLEKAKFEKLEKLDLSCNKLSDITQLKKVNFKELKELNLSHNKISDIRKLKNVKLNLLEKLDLSLNKITDINILENLNFKEIKELNLSYNKIADIKVLDKIKFEKLEKLDLNCNLIHKNKYSSIIKKLKFEINI